MGTISAGARLDSRTRATAPSSRLFFSLQTKMVLILLGSGFTLMQEQALSFQGGGTTVTGLSSTFLSDLEGLVQMAASFSIVVQLCLWSFDMCKDEATPGATKAGIISNQDDTNAYINKALNPMLQVLARYDNVIVEIINEPEWCMKEGQCETKDCVEAKDMQRFVGLISQAIHRQKAASIPVTVGSASLKWASPTVPPAVTDFWSDAALGAVVGPDAALDFFNVHYYDWMYNPQWGCVPALLLFYLTRSYLSQPRHNLIEKATTPCGRIQLFGGRRTR